MDQMKMGNFIAKLRKEKNITQQELAVRLGVNSKSVSRWENGNQSPDISLLQCLALELDVTVDELLNGEITNRLKHETEINEIVDSNKCEHEITKIKDLPDKFNYEDDIIIEAYIFGIDVITMYEEKIAYLTLKLSDMTDSIVARVVVSNRFLPKILEKIKIGTSWRFYGECYNKQFDGMGIIKMQMIPQIYKNLNDKEQRKYFFFEELDIKTVKNRKRKELEKNMKSIKGVRLWKIKSQIKKKLKKH